MRAITATGSLQVRLMLTDASRLGSSSCSYSLLCRKEKDVVSDSGSSAANSAVSELIFGGDELMYWCSCVTLEELALAVTVPEWSTMKKKLQRYAIEKKNYKKAKSD